MVLASFGATLGELVESAPRTVGPETSAREAAEIMAEYNLATLPVVDGEGCLIGVVHVDDAMEVLLPEGDRRPQPGSFFS
jgi:Mg/Co/Ni transporter MgtE